jgi:periplasmic protein TonB
VPPRASARIINLQAARLALARAADRAPPTTLGAVPLSFRQWRGELEDRAPHFRRSAWAAAAATHAIIGAAVILYAVFTRLPEPLPGIAVTLSFEPARPAAEPGPASTTETQAEASPAVPEPPAEAAPEASADVAAAPEPPQALPPPEPIALDTPPPPPEPPLATAPEVPKPVAVKPPPPAHHVAAPPRRTARAAAPPAKHPAPAPSQAAAPGVSDAAPGVSLSAGNPPMLEQSTAAPVVPPSPVAASAGNPRPDYPVMARIARLEGRLVLRVDVTVSGSAAAVAVAVSSGHPSLDEAAVDAVQGWRFDPATRRGKPVAGIIYLPIEFRLVDLKQ